MESANDKQQHNTKWNNALKIILLFRSSPLYSYISALCTLFTDVIWAIFDACVRLEINIEVWEMFLAAPEEERKEPSEISPLTGNVGSIDSSFLSCTTKIAVIEGLILSNFLAIMLLQCNSEIKGQMFPYLGEASMTFTPPLNEAHIPFG